VQISEAIRRYGVADTSTNVLVVRITSPELQDVGARMLSVVSGTISPLEDLAGITDWASIRKVSCHTP
jgi:EKC/KEOPS complex subunit CGI121/TPRKB